MIYKAIFRRNDRSNSGVNNHKRSSKALQGAGAACFLLFSLLLCGCGGSPRAFKESVMAPEPPAFMTNGTVSFLSREGSWTAKLTATGGTAARPEIRSGQLFIKGDHILFAQDKCDRTFIWDNATRKGIILSDALQGYAPFGSQNFPSLASSKSETAGGATSEVNGYAGHEAEISALMSDASGATYKLWKADALDGFPVQITFHQGTNSLGVVPPKGDGVVDILDMKKSVISDSLFSPPEGFTAYASSSAMTSEYMIRHSKTREARPTSGDGFETPPPGTQNSRPRGF